MLLITILISVLVMKVIGGISSGLLLGMFGSFSWQQWYCYHVVWWSYLGHPVGWNSTRKHKNGASTKLSGSTWDLSFNKVTAGTHKPGIINVGLCSYFKLLIRFLISFVEFCSSLLVLLLLCMNYQDRKRFFFQFSTIQNENEVCS